MVFPADYLPLPTASDGTRVGLPVLESFSAGDISK